jgi:hypothetical protein
VADGLEDLGEAEFGDEETEGASLRLMLGENVRAGTGAACDKAHALEIEDSFCNCDSGGAKELSEFRFAGEAVASLESAGLDVSVEVLEDTLVLSGGLGRHGVRGWGQSDSRFAGSCHAFAFPEGDELRIGVGSEFSLNTTTVGLDLSMQLGRRPRRNVLGGFGAGKGG